MVPVSKSAEKYIRETYQEEAKECARKLCAFGGCLIKYQGCIDKNRIEKNALKPFGIGRKCPLMKYNIPYDDTPYLKRLEIRDVGFPTDIEFFAVCANCNHSKLYEDTERGVIVVQVDEVEEMNYCFDCPVRHCREAIEEIRAEAMMG